MGRADVTGISLQSLTRRRVASGVTILLAIGTLAAAVRVSAQGPAPAAAVTPPDFGRDVMPIFESNCLRCHNTAKQSGGLLLETYEDMMRGGDDGAPIVPGRADESAMIRQLEGHAKPKMPPKTDLRPEDIAVLRAWIAAGAAYSPVPRFTLDGKVPALAQSAPLLAEIPSVAFRPDGAELAVAGYREVVRYALPGGASAGRTGELSDQVRAVAWSPDGRIIAAGGGTPGVSGELVLIDAVTGQILKTLEGHRDYVYHVAFSPDGKRLASCGYDRQIRVWDVASGKPTGVFKEHTEAVYAVAFSPDGTLLASAAADRSVKIWDVKQGVRLYTIGDATDAVLTLAFRPGTRQLAAAGTDKRLRIWDVTETAATLRLNILAHSAGIIRLAFSPDGATVATAASDREVKLWDATTGALRRTLPTQHDWAQGLAFSPDGTRLAVGRYDGTLTLFDPATGRAVTNIIAPRATSEAGKVAQR